MKENKDATFSLAYKAVGEVKALWFEFADRNWIVDPCTLFNGILQSKEDSYNPLLYPNIDNLSKRRGSLYVRQEFDGDSFTWSIKELLGEPICSLRFVYKDFLSKVERAISRLYNDIAVNGTAYDQIIQPEEIAKIYDQLKVLKLFFMPGRIRSSEVIKEQLTFDCPEKEDGEDDWGSDIPYTLRIGDHEITSYISDWTNSMDLIRYQLESYCYNRNAKIKLNYEDEPTIINLEHLSTLASAESVGPGIVYKYKDFVRVEIHPNSFVEGSAIAGICDEKDTIKELYEGLLNVGRIGYEFEEYGWNNPWDYDAIVFYNHIKSPIIERYISGIAKKYNSIVERQRIIHHVFTISPDYTHVLGQMTGQSAPVDVSSDDSVTFYKDDDTEEVLCTVTLPGLYNWLDEFNRYSDGVNSTMGEMNVQDWHHRGMILAKELKKRLPDDIDVWYGYPFEDVENRNRRPILITNGTLKEYFEEELANACLKKDKNKIDYCLSMDAEINANDGWAFKQLIASEESIDLVSEEKLKIINEDKLELFEYLLTKGLVINHGQGGIDPVLELCKTWKCDLIEKRIHEIMDSI